MWIWRIWEAVIATLVFFALMDWGKQRKYLLGILWAPAETRTHIFRMQVRS
jgi:hypothetical protein